MPKKYAKQGLEIKSMPRRTQRYSKIGDTMKTIDLSGKMEL